LVLFFKKERLPALMTERLADIGARIGGVRQLGAVVNAMRGIAAARAQQARALLTPVDTYAATIAAAIGRALPLAPPAPPGPARASTRGGLVLFCAEQGFAGAFSERVLDAAGAALRTPDLFLVGTRGLMAIAERGVKPGWTAAMPAHAPGIPPLADRVATAIYASMAAGRMDRLEIIHAQWRPGRPTTVERHALFPVDPAAFPRPADGDAPLLDLAPDELIRALTADYVHALLCRAALHAFAAENEARMQAMSAARGQVSRQLADLQARERRVRQEEITSEVIELAAGETASVGAPA
jgi:F-type H+-transporting ATPase subunit gamma